jgi:hypothetical protein
MFSNRNPFDSLSVTSGVRDPFDDSSMRSSQFDGSSTSDNISIRSYDSDDPAVRVDVRGVAPNLGQRQLKDTAHNEYMRRYMRDYMKRKREQAKLEQQHPKPQIIVLHSQHLSDTKPRRQDEIENILARSFKNLGEILVKIYDLHVVPEVECEQLAEVLRHTDILEAIEQITKFLNEHVIVEK